MINAMNYDHYEINIENDSLKEPSHVPFHHQSWVSETYSTCLYLKTPETPSDSIYNSFPTSQNIPIRVPHPSPLGLITI